jgi:hypothetical protein|tara:strand:+ start:119 stop:397 length:279 start_codon:yes stop_codon:yes gene_type:complete
MKEHLIKAFVAFYYFCLLIYVPTESHVSDNTIWTSGWELFFDINGERSIYYTHVDLDRLVLQLLAGTCLLIVIRYLIPVFSREPKSSAWTDD